MQPGVVCTTRVRVLHNLCDRASWLAGFGFEESNTRYSFTHYNNIGGDGGADFNVLSVGFLF